jgi:hypothetical protein
VSAYIPQILHVLCAKSTRGGSRGSKKMGKRNAHNDIDGPSEYVNVTCEMKSEEKVGI